MKKDTLVQNAIDWAKAHLGSEEYRLQCLGFIEDALERSNGIEIFGGDSARESAELYEVHNNMGLPPAGAFVFYSCSGLVEGEVMDWGHCGLSLGDGNVIHAWDKVRIDGYLEVEKLSPAPGWSQPVFIGWAPLEQILIGHHSSQGVW